MTKSSVRKIRSRAQSLSTAGVTSSATPIYDTLRQNAKYPLAAEKLKCIESTVKQLLDKGTHADEPGLLLGRVQCGKTDTFVKIIGLCFDRGIDIAVVLTKGTKNLASQTESRLMDDFAPLKPSDNLNQPATVYVHDIMNVRNNGIPEAVVNKSKTIIVCKKELNNMKSLIKLFDIKCPWLKDKKVLIVDDEADFASFNFTSGLSRNINNGGASPIVSKMTKIGAKISEFRDLLTYSRYLMVTATPYNLFLQPGGDLILDGNKVMGFRPRFTSLVPTHDKYVGGEQYFEESCNPDSMYSHLYSPITQDCIDVLNGVKDDDHALLFTLFQFIMATAIRRIQERAKGMDYKSSALVHVDIKKTGHLRQYLIVLGTLGEIQESLDNATLSSDAKSMLKQAYSDFKQSNQKARQQGATKVKLPSFDDTLAEMRDIMGRNDYTVQVVNSDKEVSALLDPNTGELMLNTALTIFIGALAMDRGITIKNLLCFIYGRDPSTFQQDTVLQHSRIYGARSMEDMATTRFHTTKRIYDALKIVHGLDEHMRECLEKGKDIKLVMLGVGSGIRPCAQSKVKMTDLFLVRPGMRSLPIGFQTGEQGKIGSTVQKIDAQIDGAIKRCHPDADGFFEMSTDWAIGLLQKIKSTYVYGSQYGNVDNELDVDMLIAILQFCRRRAKGKVWAMKRDNRDISRKKKDGVFTNAPDNGIKDLFPAKAKAIDKPVLMLLRQNGSKAKGWNGAPFYWPVLVTPSNLEDGILGFKSKKGNTP